MFLWQKHSRTNIDRGGGKGREKGREKAEFIAYNFSVDFYIILFAIQRNQDCPDQLSHDCSFSRSIKLIIFTK